MKISQYKVPIILFFSFAVINILIFVARDIIVPAGASQDASHLIPFTGALETNLMALVIWPIMALLGGLIGLILTPVLIWVHKLVFGRNLRYGIEEVYKSEKYKRTFIGFFPSLMAINLSLMLSNKIGIQSILISESMFDIPLMRQPVTFLVGITLTLVVSFALFSGLWALLDAGIVFSNKEGIKKKGKESPPTIQSVGGWFNYLLKGYAGIGVLFAYYDLVLIFLAAISIIPELSPFILFVNFYLFLAYIIILPVVTIPATIVMDVLRDRRVKFTRNFAAKLGIIDKVEIELKKLER